MNPIISAVAVALLVDHLFSDPESGRHPVALLGSFVSILEASLIDRGRSRLGKRFFGAILLAAAIAVVAASGVAIRQLFMFIPGGAFIFSVIAVWIAVSPRKLGDMAAGVARSLADGRLEEARLSLSCFVGRDTDGLKVSGMARAAIESVAENSVDALVAPVFYALIGGPIGALIYRAVNTLDSMVGYRNEKYAYFGWASARTDDILNFIPSRLSRFIMALSALAVTGRWRQTILFGFRDGGLHPSPNSGIPEAAMAGALNIRLGGRAFYDGVSRNHGYIGTERLPSAGDIGNSVKILRGMTIVITLLLLSIYIIPTLIK